MKWGDRIRIRRAWSKRLRRSNNKSKGRERSIPLHHDSIGIRKEGN